VTRAAQLARGAATASVAVVLAAFSHGIAGREAPGLVGLALAAVVALGASVALVGRRSTPLRTAVAVVVSQGAFHVLFGVGATSGGAFVAAGSEHHQTLAFVEGAAAVAGQGQGQGHPGHADAAMLTGHAIAAVLTIAYLLVFERAAWLALGTAAHRLLLRLTSTPEPVAVVVSVPARRPDTTRARLRGRLLFVSLRYRGPPLSLASG
jgi:hypothetical protein